MRIIKKWAAGLLCLLLLVPTAGALAVDPLDTLTNTRINGKNWASQLDDSLTLDQLNIPGTHDSGTSVLLLGKCQSKTISEQLDIGVRFLDIRLLYDTSDQKLKVVHGSVRPMFDLFFTRNVLYNCLNFIKGTGEFILMSVKEDSGDDGQFDEHVYKELEAAAADMGKTFDQCYFVADRMPALSEIRGKIVIMRRYGSAVGSPYRIGINLRDGWGDDTYSTMPRSGYTIEVQDCYSFAPGTPSDDKLSCWMKEFNKAESKEDPFINSPSARPHTLWINFASGNVWGDWIKEIADSVNPIIRAVYGKLYDTGHIRGIVPLDYAAEPVVQAIYTSNQFVSGQRQPAPLILGKAPADNEVCLIIMDRTDPSRLQYRDLDVSESWQDWGTAKQIDLTLYHHYEVRFKETATSLPGPSLKYTALPFETTSSRLSLEQADCADQVTFLPCDNEYMADQADLDSIKTKLVVYRDEKSTDTYYMYEYLTSVQGDISTSAQSRSSLSFKDFSHFKNWEYQPFSAVTAMEYHATSASDCGDLYIGPYAPSGTYLPAGTHQAYLELYHEDYGKYYHKYTVPLLFQVWPVDLNDLSAMVIIADQKTRGSEPVTPNVTVTVQKTRNAPSSITGLTLTRGVDYEVDFVANTEPGEAWALISGIGNYDGFVIEPFNISGYNVILDGNAVDAKINGVPVATMTDQPFVPSIKSVSSDRPGRVLSGWFLDPSLDTPIAEGAVLDRDVHLYAAWQALPKTGDGRLTPLVAALLISLTGMALCWHWRRCQKRL